MAKYSFSQEELEEFLTSRIPPLEVNRVISAYEMSENANTDRKMPDGSSFFDHISRTCGLIIHELEIYDPDVLSATFLFDIYHSSEEITQEIIIYNFGPYVSFLLEEIPDEISYDKIYHSDHDAVINEKLRVPGDDYLIIRLAEQLDSFRSMEYSPGVDTLNYINTIIKKYFPIAECSSNKALDYIINEIKKERSRFYC